MQYSLALKFKITLNTFLLENTVVIKDFSSLMDVNE